MWPEKSAWIAGNNQGMLAAFEGTLPLEKKKIKERKEKKKKKEQNKLKSNGTKAMYYGRDSLYSCKSWKINAWRLQGLKGWKEH